MKLIIDIDEELYNYMQTEGYDEHLSKRFDYQIRFAVKDGIPLPKGHGRLIDISKLDYDRVESNNPVIYLTINGEYIEAVSLDYLNSLPTIIEPDKGGNNEATN